MHEVDLSKALREETRWRILRILDAGRPGEVSETIILRALSDIRLHSTMREIRRDLKFLEGLGLIRVEGEDSPEWLAGLTAHGVNIVEYAAPAPAGITRPKRWS